MRDSIVSYWDKQNNFGTSEYTKNYIFTHFIRYSPQYRLRMFVKIQQSDNFLSLFTNPNQIKNKGIFQSCIFYPLKPAGSAAMSVIHVDVKNQQIIVGF
ncbi:MAG: hypothetical protein FD181_1201 [Prolixibacteraceae bacterium]|nr:MAG: hypothetical protein FD181_1201 [Prolixibacteraceae bacterium]